jgi:hypothetical protein
MVIVPTATQKLLLTQETPRNSADCVPTGSAAGVAIDHADPFHCSMSATVVVDPSTIPTAMQNEGPAHETLWRNATPPGSGALTDAHDEPFHCSINAL